MIQKIKDILKSMSEDGVYFPYARDTTTDKPSSTLFFAYTSFLLAFISIVVLIIFNPLYGAIAGISFWFLAVVLYLMRRISTFRVDIDDQEFELASEQENKLGETENDK